MAEGKKSFVLYADYIDLLDGYDEDEEHIDGMTDEQAGKWIKTIFRYVNDLNPIIDDDIKQAFILVRKDLKRDLKKYNARVESIAKARENNKNNKKSNCNQTEISMTPVRNQTEISSVNVNVNDNVNVNVNDINSNINNLTNLNNKLDLDNNISCSKSDSKTTEKYSIQKAFDYWWSIYPKKIGKEKCLNWFKTHKPDRELAKKMCDATEKWKQSDQWKDQEGKFIPNPYTWLNRGGWNDELSNENKKDIYGGFDVL